MRTPAVPALVALFVLAAVAVPAHAAGYATDRGGVLYQVIPDEPSIERIGVVSVTTRLPDGSTRVTRPTLTDLAISDLHGLYGISFTTLYRVDVRDPSRSVRVGTLRKDGTGSFNALAFDDKGRLFALEGGTLHQVDLETGRARVLGSLGGHWGSDGDLAWVGDALYATVNGGAIASACHLVRIDMTTWKATDVGRIRQERRRATPTTPRAGSEAGGRPPSGPEGAGPQGARPRVAPLRTFDDVWGLIWDGRDLYGVTARGELIQIDHASGRALVVTKVRASFYGACAMLRI